MIQDIKIRKEELSKEAVEEALFAQVISEMESGSVRKGLWAKALVSTNGDIKRANTEYIKLRIQSILNEHELATITKYELSEQKRNIARERDSQRRKVSLDREKQKEREENIISFVDASLIGLGVAFFTAIVYFIFTS